MIEAVICCVFLSALFFFMGVCILYALVQPYCAYHLHKSKNKIQWKCVETENSFNKRLTTYDPITKEKGEFVIYYRTMPSEVNWFVRVFGDNDWKCPFQKTFLFYQYDGEESFKNVVKDYVTLEDVKKLEKKEGKITWYHP